MKNIIIVFIGLIAVGVAMGPPGGGGGGGSSGGTSCNQDGSSTTYVLNLVFDLKLRPLLSNRVCFVNASSFFSYYIKMNYSYKKLINKQRKLSLYKGTRKHWTRRVRFKRDVLLRTVAQIITQRVRERVVSVGVVPSEKLEVEPRQRRARKI